MSEFTIQDRLDQVNALFRRFQAQVHEELMSLHGQELGINWLASDDLSALRIQDSEDQDMLTRPVEAAVDRKLETHRQLCGAHRVKDADDMGASSLITEGVLAEEERGYPSRSVTRHQ